MIVLYIIFAVIVVLVLAWGVPAVLSTFFGAPWSPTPKESVHAMHKMAKVGKNDLVYDLGSGFGRISMIAAKDYDARSVGIEIDPIKHIISESWAKISMLTDRVQFIRGNFFDVDLSDADVVTCYLLHPTNKKLMDKFESELKIGTRIVSHSFTFPGWKMIDKDETKNLFLYVTGESY